MTPQIIRTIEELKALDPWALLGSLTDDLHPPMHIMPAVDWAADYTIDPDYIFPLVVIASGEQMTAAQEALEEA